MNLRNYRKRVDNCIRSPLVIIRQFLPYIPAISILTARLGETMTKLSFFYGKKTKKQSDGFLFSFHNPAVPIRFQQVFQIRDLLF